jgi:hypothetical protein
LPRPRYPLKKCTTEEADDVIEFDRAMGGAVSPEVDSREDSFAIGVELGSEIGGRSIPECCSSTAPPLNAVERPKNDSLLFSLGGVGVLRPDGNPHVFILDPLASEGEEGVGEEGRGVAGVMIGLRGTGAN